MSEFPKVTFNPATVRYFAHCLTRSLQSNGRSKNEIRKIASEEVLRFFNNAPELREEAEQLSSNPNNVTEGKEVFESGGVRVPNYFLVQQACTLLNSGESISYRSDSSKKTTKEKRQVAV